MSEGQICTICFDPETAGKLVNICQNKGASVCKECLMTYISSKISEGYPGTCPILKCPLCTGYPKCILFYPDLAQVLTEDQINDYNSLATSLSSIQCGKCHCRRNLFISDVDIVDATEKVEAHISRPKVKSWRESLNAFERGHIDVSEFYNSIITEYCVDILTSQDDRVALELMSDILKVVRNPERRSSLQLRHLKFRPRVWTPCCQNEQCFRCRTRDFHNGLTCDKLSASLGGDIVRCGVCGVHVVKGDGCDSITCVCGSRFSFSTELAKVNLAVRFQEAFPQSTAYFCVWVQCGSTEGNAASAAAWEQCHKEDCIVHYSNWWRTEHSIYTSQQALQISSQLDRFPIGTNAYRALQMWITIHPDEMQRCRLQQEIALKEIVGCYCVDEQDRIQAGRSLVRKQQPVPRQSVAVASPHSCMLGGLSACEKAKVLSFADALYKHDEVLLTTSTEDGILALHDSALQFISLFGTREVKLQFTEAYRLGSIPCYQLSEGSGDSQAAPIDDDINFFARFAKSFTLHVGDTVSRLDNGDVKRLGVIVVDNEDGTYDVRWEFGCVDTLHRASLKFERPCVFVASSIPMSRQQVQTFENFLAFLRVLLSSEGDALREKDRLVDVWEESEHASEGTAHEEAQKLQGVLRAVSRPEDLQLLCNMNSLLPDQNGRYLRWVDLYFACGWAGSKGRHIYEQN